jgi:hypothetical protein
MAIFLEHCTFIHIPKTGGTWVGEVLDDLGLALSGEAGDHRPAETDKPCFAFVRDPEDWVVSWWCHRKRNGWNWQDRRLENECKSEDFTQWIENIIGKPGIVEQALLDFVLPYEAVRLGKTENIRHDLIKFLGEFGETFDEQVVLDKEEIHVSEDKPKIPSDLIDEFRHSQIQYYRHYQYGDFDC